MRTMSDRQRMTFLQWRAAVLTWVIVTGFALFLAWRGGETDPEAQALDASHAQQEHAANTPVGRPSAPVMKLRVKRGFRPGVISRMS